MHHYGLHSAKYGFIFLATAQAPHRRFILFFCQKSNLCLICLQIISPLHYGNIFDIIILVNLSLWSEVQFLKIQKIQEIQKPN